MIWTRVRHGLSNSACSEGQVGTCAHHYPHQAANSGLVRVPLLVFPLKSILGTIFPAQLSTRFFRVIVRQVYNMWRIQELDSFNSCRQWLISPKFATSKSFWREALRETSSTGSWWAKLNHQQRELEIQNGSQICSHGGLYLPQSRWNQDRVRTHRTSGTKSNWTALSRRELEIIGPCASCAIRCLPECVDWPRDLQVDLSLQRTTKKGSSDIKLVDLKIMLTSQGNKSTDQLLPCN